MLAADTTNADLDLLAQVSQMLTELDRNRVLEKVIDLTANAVGAERATLLLHPQYDDDWRQIFFRNFIEASAIPSVLDREQSIRMAQRAMTDGLAGWVLRHQEGAIVYDTATDDRWRVFPDSESGARSALCVPFLYAGQSLAVLTLIHRQPNHFDERHLRLMMIVANQATVALRNAQLFNRLMDQQRQLEAVMHAIPDILIALDHEGQIMVANEAASAFLNVDGDMQNIAGRMLSDYMHLDNTLWAILDVVSDANAGQIGHVFETRSERERRDFLVTVSPWRSDRAEKSAHVIVMRDVSNLRDLNRFKDEMFKLLSHDLRSPLALIVGYCSLVELDAPPDSPILDYVAAMQKASSRMKGMLDDLMKVEKIRSSPVEMNEQVEMAELVAEAVGNGQMNTDAKRQTLTSDVQLEGVPSLAINRALVQESLENYIHNASKYTPEGGRIRVRAWVEREEGRVYVVVEDNGMGIPKEAQSQLFQSFYRVRSPGFENTDGRGLGLSLVKTIMERHFGGVWVESELGEGSRFGLWLPLTH